MTFLFWLWLLTSLISAAPKGRKQMIDVLQAVKFGNCDESYKKKEDYGYFANITIDNIGKGKNAINGQFVNMYAAKKTTATYKLFNCKSELEAECELFGTYQHKDYCATATEKGQYYSTIYLAFHPPLGCPLKKNAVHHIRNATVDAELTLKLGKLIPGIRQFHWMSKTQMYALPEMREFGCLKMMFKFGQAVHQIRNATVDATRSLQLGKFVPGVGQFHWMSKTQMYAVPEMKEIGCLKMMFRYAQIRV